MNTVTLTPSALGAYADPDSHTDRQIVTVNAANGSVLVIDRLADTHADARLLAHLHPDEPVENAALICSIYLADPNRGRCRLMTPEDLEQEPVATTRGEIAPGDSTTDTLRDHDGLSYRIRRIAPNDSFPQLRWTTSPGRDEQLEAIRLRDLVGRLEDYEPALSITATSLARHHHDRALSTHCLRAELQRLLHSSIVLNRRLREVVKQKTATGELTMSEIAIRCGRVKRDSRGNQSGETSWLARRIGQIPEGGQTTPTPWVSSDVLALIARDGLGISPRDVEATWSEAC